VANDTIVAVATAPGESAIAVTRLSGPQALSIASKLFHGRTSPAASASHRILFGSLLAADGRAIDSVLLSVFRAPFSYTGEDVVEISSHGGSVIPAAVVEAAVAAGARPARPGEFTERAFRNGKLDLAQAESVAALIRARSERAARAAQSALGGSLTRRVEALDAELVSVLAEVEARIDFPVDVGEAVDGAALAARCAELAGVVRGWIDGVPGSRRAQEGVSAALVGKPNVGKSSLLNALVGFDRAIVSGEPGTTRDTLDASIWMDGVEIRLTDTAGVRSGVGEGAGGGGAEGLSAVEREGVERSRRMAESCDLAVLVLDRETGVGDEDLEIAGIVRDRPVVVAWNKSDLGGAGPRPFAPVAAGSRVMAEVETVAVRPGGAEPLRGAIRSALPTLLGAHAGAEACLTSSRQEALLVEASSGLERAVEGLRSDRSYDLIAVDLAEARRALGGVVGRGVDDAVVTALFARFCIGK
jgi:tRNA modification GTPase